VNESEKDAEIPGVIEQIRQLQSRVPFEKFAIELQGGDQRVIQIFDPYSVATTEDMICVLYEKNNGLEVFPDYSIASVSVGWHPKSLERFKRSDSKTL
jgi:hypothetical protein